MTHKTNYKAIPLSSGTFTTAELGDGMTSPAVHVVYCLSDGNATITALGGGEFTWTATAGQSINVQVGKFVINSGTYVGFKERGRGSGRVNNSNIKI